MQPVRNLTTDDSACELCRKPFKDNERPAEMFNPELDDGSYVVHETCGRRKRWEVA